jgi:hypothetical protein
MTGLRQHVRRGITLQKLWDKRCQRHKVLRGYRQPFHSNNSILGLQIDIVKYGNRRAMTEARLFQREKMPGDGDSPINRFWRRFGRRKLDGTKLGEEE